MGEEASALGAAFGGPELVPPPVQEMTALQRSETQEAVVAYLTELGAAEPWDLAPALVAIGWTADSLREALASSDSDVRSHLARWLGLSAAIGQLLQDLGIGADRISELVRVVKEYSFLDQAPIQEIDPTDGIEDTLILLKHKLADIEVILDFEENLPTVEAAGRDLNQVWTNLIDNAADAMDGSGKLTITARREGSDVVVTVADTGPGIPEETVARIFDPFFTTKEPGKGTGLGLHTVHNIVSRSGGTITVRSDGSGTAFEVRLPAVS
jgi:signal transduction histidine kinase